MVPSLLISREFTNLCLGSPSRTTINSCIVYGGESAWLISITTSFCHSACCSLTFLAQSEDTWLLPIHVGSQLVVWMPTAAYVPADHHGVTEVAICAKAQVTPPFFFTPDFVFPYLREVLTWSTTSDFSLRKHSLK